MSSVLCFCVWQQAAKEQCAKSITSRSGQARFACLFDCIIENEYVLKVIKLSDRFSSLRITFILVYQSQWTNACVMSIWILYIYIHTYTYIHVNLYTHIGKLKKKLKKVFSFCFYKQTDTIFRYLMRSPIEFVRRITISTHRSHLFRSYFS